MLEKGSDFWAGSLWNVWAGRCLLWLLGGVPTYFSHPVPPGPLLPTLQPTLAMLHPASGPLHMQNPGLRLKVSNMPKMTEHKKQINWVPISEQILTHLSLLVFASEHSFFKSWLSMFTLLSNASPELFHLTKLKPSPHETLKNMEHFTILRVVLAQGPGSSPLCHSSFSLYSKFKR